MSKVLVFLALATSLAACRERAATRHEEPAARPAPKPFTRESALEKVRAQYPAAALPADELPPGVSAQEDIVYARGDGYELALDVYAPSPAEPRVGADAASALRPALLVVHGGGWETGDRKMERPFAKQLAKRGYVAVPVSYRLGASGRFPNALHDLKNAVCWLRANATRFAIDAAHVGAVGGSAGGQLVALLGATNGIGRFESGSGCPNNSSSVQAVVDIDGLADFAGPELLAKEAREPGAPTRFLGGPQAARAAVWRDASAITHVGPNAVPTLFINSTAKTPILPGRAEMCRKLQEIPVDCRIVVIPNTPHPFWLLAPWFERTLAETDTFLREQWKRPSSTQAD